MNNRFNLNEEEKNRIRNLHGIINEQFKSSDVWPFTMHKYDFENNLVTPGGTGLPQPCDKCLMATIPEQYLDKDKRFDVFKAIVKLLVQVSGSRYNLTGAKGTEDQFGNKLSTDTVSTWEKPIIKVSEIVDILKDFSPLDAIEIAKDLFKCATNECSPKKIHEWRKQLTKDIVVDGEKKTYKPMKKYFVDGEWVWHYPID